MPNACFAYGDIADARAGSLSTASAKTEQLLFCETHSLTPEPHITTSTQAGGAVTTVAPAAAVTAVALLIASQTQTPVASVTPHAHAAASSTIRATHVPATHFQLPHPLGSDPVPQPYRVCANPGSSWPLQSGSCAPDAQSHPSHLA